MAIVDFHNHFYPPEYLRAVQVGASNVKVTFDADRNPVLHYPGDYNVVVPGHRDLAFRESVLDKVGVGRQVLTLTTPGTHVESPERATMLARIVNDAFAQIMAHGDRFAALATLPLNDPGASVAEFERATGDLGFKGVMVFGNVNGIPLSDERYWPLYERASELKAIIYIHPTHPVGVEAMMDYWLMPLVGFTFDTTLGGETGLQRRRRTVSWDSLGPGPSRGSHPLPGRAARPRILCVRGVPAAHQQAAQHLPERLLLRHREFRPEGSATGSRLCRNGPSAGRQRLPPSDRQPGANVGKHR